MLKKNITYVDFNGVEKTEEYYFNLSKAKLIRMEAGTPGGLQKKIEEVTKSNDNTAILDLLEEVILAAYGKKVEDENGQRFVQSKELSEQFFYSEAYSELLVELLSDENAASDFMKGIVPANTPANIPTK